MEIFRPSGSLKGFIFAVIMPSRLTFEFDKIKILDQMRIRRALAPEIVSLTKFVPTFFAPIFDRKLKIKISALHFAVKIFGKTLRVRLQTILQTHALAVADLPEPAILQRCQKREKPEQNRDQ